jgi:hypothetical protein
MTQVSRLVLLIPVVTLACSGAGPSDPSQATSQQASESVAGGASAMAQQGCRNIVSVSLRAAPLSTSRFVALRAAYAYADPASPACTVPPAWSASRRGLTIDAADPFRVSITRLPGMRTIITATAPNGVAETITIS